jgi:hypothetical protein
MAKTTVSHRLDDDLLAWANGYAKERGTSRSVLLEEGLRALRGLSEGGVPDIPVEKFPEEPAITSKRPKLEPREETPHDWAMQRQAKLNQGKYR